MILSPARSRQIRSVVASQLAHICIMHCGNSSQDALVSGSYSISMQVNGKSAPRGVRAWACPFGSVHSSGIVSCRTSTRKKCKTLPTVSTAHHHISSFPLSQSVPSFPVDASTSFLWHTVHQNLLQENVCCSHARRRNTRGGPLRSHNGGSFRLAQAKRGSVNVLARF